MYLLSIKKLQPIHYLFAAVVLTAGLGCQPSNQLPPEVQQQLANPKSSSENSLSSKAEAFSVNPAKSSDAEDGKSTSEPNKSSTSDNVAADNGKPPTPEIEVRTFDVAEQPWIQQLPWSYSEAHYVGATRIGYARLKVEKAEIESQIRVLREDTIDRAADGSIIPARRVVLETYERPSGELMSFRFEAKTDGKLDLLVEGRRRLNDNFNYVRRTELAAETAKVFPWNSKFWGPSGVQEMLMREPMKPGEARESSLFIPQLMEFVPIQLEATKTELTPLADGKTLPLLQVILTMGAKEPVTRSALFVDENGVIQKTISHNEGQMLLKFRIEEDVANRLANQSQFARLLVKSVPFSGDAAAIESSSSIIYDVEAELGDTQTLDPYDALLAYNRQRLKSRSPTVCAIQVSGALKIEDDRQPNAADLETSLTVPADKPLMIELANEFLGNSSEKTEVDRAELLRSGLNKNFSHRPMTNEINSTLSAARQRSGNCIEVAHVFAALLRSQKIACRIALGVRYNPSKQAFDFHVWNQAWLNEKWTDLDATQSTKVGSGYITMSTNSGDGENPYSHYLKILPNINILSGISLFSAEK